MVDPTNSPAALRQEAATAAREGGEGPSIPPWGWIIGRVVWRNGDYLAVLPAVDCKPGYDRLHHDRSGERVDPDGLTSRRCIAAVQQVVATSSSRLDERGVRPQAPGQAV